MEITEIVIFSGLGLLAGWLYMLTRRGWEEQEFNLEKRVNWDMELNKIRERLDELRMALDLKLVDEIVVGEHDKLLQTINKRLRKLEKRDGELKNWVNSTIEALEIQQRQIEQVQDSTGYDITASGITDFGKEENL